MWSPRPPGSPIPPNFKCDQYGEDVCVKLEKPENIVGLQCSTWSETLVTDDHLLMNIFPRVFACAERAANPRPAFLSVETEDFELEWEKFVRKTPKYIKNRKK